MALVDATEATLPSLLTANRVVLLDCGAAWCAPCQRMDPVVAQVAEEVEGVAIVAKLDVDASPRVAKALGVQSIPTFLLFRDGRLVERHVGVATKAALVGLCRGAARPRGGAPGPRRLPR